MNSSWTILLLSTLAVECFAYSALTALRWERHLAMAFVLAVVTISFALRLFGRLGRRMELGRELFKGNVAV